MPLRTLPVSLAGMAVVGGLLGGVPAHSVPLAPADPPKPKPTPIKVRWDWRMPATMSDANGRDGIPDARLKPVPGYPDAGHARYGPIPANGRYVVKLDASKSRGSGQLTCDWVVGTSPRVARKGVPCTEVQRVRLPEGRWKLRLTVSDRTGSKTRTDTIAVKNVLMGIMGDSYASGEGFPPFRKVVKGQTVIAWDEVACQRSRWSGFVRAALQVEQADSRSNVTLIDVACAGAQIEESDRVGISQAGGLLSPQRKLAPNGEPGDYLPPQIDQLRAIAGKRPWDVMLLSIGGNDTGLSPIVKTCFVDDVILRKGNCYMQPVVGTTSAPLWQVVDTSLAALERRFERLAPCVSAAGGAATCRTVKIAGNAPAPRRSRSKPAVITNLNTMMQAMYPDLTHFPNPSGPGLAPCYVQSPVQTPLNQIDNTWAYGTLFRGTPGRPVHLPTTFPQFEKPDPNPVVPTQKGLVPQLRDNRAEYGWRIGLSLFRASHPHGVCAPQPWEYGITDALQQGVSNVNGVLHPNDEGQAAYAAMLGPASLRMADLPHR